MVDISGVLRLAIDLALLKSRSSTADRVVKNFKGVWGLPFGN